MTSTSPNHSSSRSSEPKPRSTANRRPEPTASRSQNRKTDAPPARQDQPHQQTSRASTRAETRPETTRAVPLANEKATTVRPGTGTVTETGSRTRTSFADFAGAFTPKQAPVAGAAAAAPAAAAPRALRGDEEALLRSVYGNQLDYGQIQVVEIPDNRAHTDGGNVIHMPAAYYDAAGNLIDANAREILVHEAQHVLDHQRSPVGSAIAFGITGFVRVADEAVNPGANHVYDWQASLAGGLSLLQMNPEARAKAVQDMYAANADGAITAADGYTAAEVAFLIDVRDDLIPPPPPRPAGPRPH